MTLDPAAWPGGLAYVAIFLAAALEGELVFVAAAALVGAGQLHATAVVTVGALGAAFGDQVPFYLLRHRIRSWADRLSLLQRAGQAAVPFVRRRPGWLPLIIRFAPGLRIAIAAACAYADVPAWLFSACSLVSAFLWASGIVGLVAWLGPTWLSHAGLDGWWGLAVPAVLVIAAFGIGARAAQAAAAGGDIGSDIGGSDISPSPR